VELVARGLLEMGLVELVVGDDRVPVAGQVPASGLLGSIGVVVDVGPPGADGGGRLFPDGGPVGGAVGGALFLPWND
jgi:hypothetical protein